MIIKPYLQKLQKLLPSSWLEQIQYIHSILLFRWILHGRSQPLVCNQKSAMVFSPHQDDETFGCGGMIAQKREQGTQVVVVFVTDGQGSGGLETSRDQIIQIRKQEALIALSILGVAPSEIHFLQKTDGRLQELSSQEQQQTIKQIAELVKYYQPEEIYVPHRKDCHRDHEATYQLVKLAISQCDMKVDLLQYPIWLFWRAPLFILLKLQDIAAASCLTITSVQEKKTRAIASYSSQIQSLPRGFIKRFLGAYEIFFKA
ncbi:LmbE-like protein [Nostoc sp. NIES-4103]|nr:LmbE-like protein [Nostoc sp. NIES-4103]